jgi:DNA-binding SARP family transcriptional activator/tetratricopeptide (TPR) repeat protein
VRGPVGIDLLGRFGVHREGREVPRSAFGGRQARLLLRFLAVGRGTLVTRDALIEVLWPSRQPAAPEANLNVLVNRARRGLGDLSLIETVTGGYLLRAGPDVDVDVERFGAALERARSAMDAERPAKALRDAEAALSEWRGDPLPEDADTVWAVPHRECWERMHVDALELAARAALAVGDTARAGEHAGAAARLRPLRESARILQARTLAAGGDRAAALRSLDALRRDLAEELGVDPGPEASDLYLQLLRGRSPPAQPPPCPRPTRFVGRDRELALLRGLGDAHRVALVEGCCGSGRSRLLDELSTATDRTVLAARALPPDRGTPWSLLRQLLGQAGTGPDGERGPLPRRRAGALGALLGECPQRALARPSSRARLLDAAVRVLAAQPRPLLLIDDLHWADAASTDALSAILPRAVDSAVVLTYRKEELVAQLAVARFLDVLRSTTRTVELSLGPLAPAALTALIDDPQIVSVLAETDATPLAVSEVLHELDQAGVVRRDHGGRWCRNQGAGDVHARARAAARTGQQRAIRARVGHLPAIATELLGLLALLGRPAPARQLAAIAGRDVTADLDVLTRAELVRLEPAGFTTALGVAETVREALNAVERAGLHDRIARALPDDAVTSEERAIHLAGAGDLQAAAAAYAVAAGERLGGSAHRDARRLAGVGLTLGPVPAIRAELLEIRASARERDGERNAAREDLRAALACAGGTVARARLLTRLAAMSCGAEDLTHAGDLVDLALAAAGADPAARARALAVGAIVDMNVQQSERAEQRYAEARLLFERIGDVRGMADVFDARAMACFLDGHITKGIKAFDRVARLFADAGEVHRAVIPRSTRGHGLLFADLAQDALADTAKALALARSLGYAEGEAYASWHHSEALTAAGRTALAIETAERGLALAQRIGHRGWTAAAYRAHGMAQEAAGDLHLAQVSFGRSLAAADGFPLLTSWAHARLGRVLILLGDTAGSARHIDTALATGPPLGHYEARLARVALAVARSEPDVARLVARARENAVRGGHRLSLRHLTALAPQAMD